MSAPDLSDIPTNILQAIYAEHQEQASEADQHADELPSDWAARCIPSLTLEPYQAEIVDALALHHKVSARGPRGLGKTTLASIVILWFSCTRELAGKDWKIVTTAASWHQLRNYLWPEVHRWARKLDWEQVGLTKWRDGEEMLKTEIQLHNGAATATSPDKPDLIEGAHAESVLVLFDESKVINTDVFDAVEGIFSNVGNDHGAEGFALAVSTPGSPTGRFYDIHKRKQGLEDWWVRRVTLDECIAAGRITAEVRERLANLWGEGSAKFRNHVLGEFAADDELSLIPLSWVEASMDAWVAFQDDPEPLPGAIRFGLDVARHGSDKTVKVRRRGHVIQSIVCEQHTDNVATLATEVAAEMNAEMLPTSVCVDSDGLGAGTGDRARELLGDGRVVMFHGGQRDDWTDVSGELRAYNNRSAAWWHVREWLDPALPGPRLLLPPDDELLADLTGPRQVADASGKIRLESKDQTKKRLGRSPDKADAVVYACWEPPPEPPPPTEWIGTGDLGETAATYKRKRR